MRDCLARGESPIASHLLYTQPGVLRDAIPAERQKGIDAGLAWRSVAEASVVYIDRGISNGMRHGMKAAVEHGLPIEYRTMGARGDAAQRMLDEAAMTLAVLDGIPGHTGGQLVPGEDGAMGAHFATVSHRGERVIPAERMPFVNEHNF